MLYTILLIFAAFFGGYTYLSNKYNNPNKLIFIFGKKGSGKSTYMVSLMLQKPRYKRLHISHGLEHPPA